MGEQRVALGSATAHWNDYVGTAAADDAAAVLSARSLYQVAGLDRDRWSIVSIDIERADADYRVTVYAFDRQQGDADSTADLQELGQQDGGLMVTAFHLDDPDRVEVFRNEAFKRLAIRLTARGLVDTALTVTAHEQLPVD
ncbi:MAG TPA: hypothetical protein VF635_15925 [Propionibacteriaceae bacterium]